MRLAMATDGEVGRTRGKARKNLDSRGRPGMSVEAPGVGEAERGGKARHNLNTARIHF